MFDRVNVTLTERLLYYIGRFTILIDKKHDYQKIKLISGTRISIAYFEADSS